MSTGTNFPNGQPGADILNSVVLPLEITTEGVLSINSSTTSTTGVVIINDTYTSIPVHTDATTSYYVSQAIAAAITSGRSFRGGYDASTNLFPATGGSGAGGVIEPGDYWVITTIGTLGGQSVVIGDTVLSLVTAPGQTTGNWLIESTVVAVTTIGTLDGGTANANAATIVGASLYLQSASATEPGIVNTTTQSITGTKNFQGNVTSLGQFAVGTGTPSSGSEVTIVTPSGSSIGINLSGTINSNATGNLQYGESNTLVFTSTSSTNSAIGHYISNIFASSAGDASFYTATGLFVQPGVNSNNNTYSITGISAGIGATTGTGTVANAFSGYFTAPVSNTSTGNAALYADNMSIGLSSVNLHGTNNLSVSGKTITTSFQMTTSPTSGYYLQSDASGNGTWAAAPTAVTTIGTLDGGTANSNAATISGSTLYLQSASSSQPGIMNTAIQSISGTKHFGGNLTSAGQFSAGTASTSSGVLVSFVMPTAFSTCVSYTGAINANNASNLQFGQSSALTFTCTTATIQSVSLYMQPQFTPVSGGLSSYTASGIVVLPSLNSNFNASSLIGISGGIGATTGTGTVANAWSGYFTSPAITTSTGNAALYADNMSIGSVSTNLHGTNNLSVSGKTITTSFQMTTSPTNGYYLQSDASGNGTWAAIPTAVTTIGTLDGGTANSNAATITGSTLYLQSASATEPGIMNTTTQTIAGAKTFSGNFVTDSQVALSISAISTSAAVTVGAGEAISMSLIGTKTATTFSSIDQYGISLTQSLNPTTGVYYCGGILMNPSYSAPSGYAIQVASDFRSSPNYTTNVGTIVGSYGFYYDGGSLVAGTVTNLIGGVFLSPYSGSTAANLALYSDNFSIGYFSANLHGTNNFIVSGSSGLGTSTPVANTTLTIVANSGSAAAVNLSGNVTVDSAGAYPQYGVLNNLGFIATTNTESSTVYDIYSSFTPVSGGASTLYAGTGISSFVYMNSNYNMESICAISGEIGSTSGTGIIANAWTGYFTAPTITSTTGNMALYADNMSIGDSTQNLNGTHNLFVSGKTITGTFQLTTGATNGYYLKSDASGNATWAAVSGGSGVTTIGTLDGGTANSNAATISGANLYFQSASATNPGVVNTVAQSFLGDKTFSGNLIVNSSAAIGTTISSSSQLNLSQTVPFGLMLAGTTSTLSSGNSAAITISNTTNVTGAGSSTVSGINCAQIYAVSSSITLPNAYGMIVQQATTGNVGTITNLFGVYVPAGAAISGTVTNAYAGYFAAPNASVSGHNLALYADNFSVGYPNKNLHGTSNMVVAGYTSFGVASPNANTQMTIAPTQAYGITFTGTQSLTDSNSKQIGIYCNQTISPTGGVTLASTILAQTPVSAPSGQTIISYSGMYSTPTFNTNVGTVTYAYGFLYDGAGAITGTVTNFYGAYFASPPSGSATANMALYADNMSIGYKTLNLNGTHNLSVAGTTATSAFQLTTGGTSNYYLQSDGSGNGTWAQLNAQYVAGSTSGSLPGAGFVGQYVYSTASAVSAPTAGNYGDSTSISLTTGVWVISVDAYSIINGATGLGTWSIGISTTSGNSSTGLTPGYNQLFSVAPSTLGPTSMSISDIEVSISSTTVYYFKTYFSAYTSGPPQVYGTIKATRIA